MAKLAPRGVDVHSVTEEVAASGTLRSKRTLLLEAVLGVVLLVLPVAGSSIGRGQIGSPLAGEMAVKGVVVLAAIGFALLFGSGRWPTSRSWWILLTLTGFLLATSPFAVSPAVSILDAVLLLGATVVVGLLAANIGAFRTLRALACASALLVLAGLAVERWFERSTENVLGDGGLFGFDRVAGVFTDANTMGQSAAVGAVASVILLARFRSSDIGAVAGAVCLVGLAASQSRTAAVGLVAGLVVVLVRARFARWLASVAVLVMVGFALLLPGAESFGVESLTRSGDANEVATLTGRTRVWRAVINQVPERAVIGHGAGSSPEVLSELIRDGRVSWPALHAHNAALQVLLTGGAVALLLLVASIVSWFASGDRDRQLDALVWLVIVGTVTEVLVMRTPSTYWLVLAMVFAVGGSGRR